jgi:hypothetical protein
MLNVTSFSVFFPLHSFLILLLLHEVTKFENNDSGIAVKCSFAKGMRHQSFIFTAIGIIQYAIALITD